ncbi:cytochrome P450 9e2-like [Harmonia axyridis]|uniref:cytochrome P450 9e2-like n=1 Tax=Harmonia axyridis TaxID=115357 RepID=UPI001E276406|nr:cytochrome P450 9e2-like [Harmonia axyridis]
MFWLLFCAVLLVVFVFLKKKYTYWKEKGVVQDLAVPVFGLNWKLLTHQASNIEIFQYLYDKHKKERYIGVYDFLTPIVIIKDPDLLQEVLIKKFEHFTDHRPTIPSDVDPLWNKNVANLKGNKWKEMRSSLSPSFTSNKMRVMFVLMEQCAKNFVQYFLLKNEEIVETEIRESFSRYISDVIASTCFGYQCNSMIDPDNEFYVKGLQASYDMSFWRHVKSSLLRVFPWMSKVIKVTRFGDDCTRFFRDVIKENVEFRDKNNVKRPDMITLLMEARNESPSNQDKDKNDSRFLIYELNASASKKKIDLTVDDIAANAMVFFFAGFSTTTSLLCFMTYELAVNPDIQKKLLEEIDSLRKKTEKINYEDLNELSHLHMIISETMRKYPPFCRNDRRCTKSFTIKNEEYPEKSFTIEAGHDIWFPIYALHHDSQYWPEPEKFIPERFSPENKKNIKPGTYLPFGIGPRGCMGYRFVLQTVKILFYELLSEFEIIPVAKTAIPCQLSKNTSHVIPGKGFWFGFKRREQSI